MQGKPLFQKDLPAILHKYIYGPQHLRQNQGHGKGPADSPDQTFGPPPPYNNRQKNRENNRNPITTR